MARQAVVIPAVFKTVDFLRLRPSTGSGRAETVNDIKATTAQAEPVEAGFTSLSTPSLQAGVRPPECRCRRVFLMRLGVG